jgi:NAD(P)-dependent dehydrogenase (short-subunit alcohol dehydrogenase family)
VLVRDRALHGLQLILSVRGPKLIHVSVDLRDRVAIVTGGGRGIGRAIALGYARAGAEVVISAARNLDEAETVAGAGEALAGNIHAVQADVTVAGDVERLVAYAMSLRGRIDVLVNNAARGMKFVNERFMTDPKPFWEADPGAWAMVMETNTVGVFLMTRAVMPHMLGAGRGSIINVTINHETMVRRGFSPYGPSKAALEAMTSCWAAELEGTGVHINLLLPGGATATGMVPGAVPEGLRLLDPEIVVEPAVHLALADRSGERVVATEW